MVLTGVLFLAASNFTLHALARYCPFVLTFARNCCDSGAEGILRKLIGKTAKLVYKNLNSRYSR